MPPNRPCLHAGCPKLTPRTYCPDHARQVDRARRDPELDSPRWRRFRKQVLARHRASNGYLCPGYETAPHLADRLGVDHIVARANGGAMYDEANVQVLCSECNGRKGTR